MPLLVGRDDIGNFGSGSFLGFGGGNASTVTHTALTNGEADTLNTAVAGFGSNTNVQVIIYEQVGGVGAFNAVRAIDVPSSAGAGTQSTAISPVLPITQGNVYATAFSGDFTSLDVNDSASFSISRDTSVVSPDGIGSVSTEYPTYPDPRPTITREIDGELYWNLSGTDLGPSGDLAVTFTLETKNLPGTLEPDKSYNVTVFNPAGTILVAQQSITSVSSVILIDSQSLTAAGTQVDVKVEDPAETDPLARIRMYRLTVFDQLA